MTQIIGWVSSAVLFATIVVQVRKQWAERTAKGVSKGLFVGQAMASLGFLVYSALLGNAVFVVTNAAMLIAAIVGAAISFRFASRGVPPGPEGVETGRRG